MLFSVILFMFSATECSLAVARCRSLQDPNAAEIELDHYGHCEHLTNASRQV